MPSRIGWLLVSPPPANRGRGLDLGGRIPVSAYGPLGYAAVTAANLGGCLAQYSRIRNDALAWTLLLTPTGIVLQGQECIALGTARGFVMDTVAAALLGLMETALGYQPPGSPVDLPVDPP